MNFSSFRNLYCFSLTERFVRRAFRTILRYLQARIVCVVLFSYIVCTQQTSGYYIALYSRRCVAKICYLFERSRSFEATKVPKTNETSPFFTRAANDAAPLEICFIVVPMGVEMEGPSFFKKTF